MISISKTRIIQKARTTLRLRKTIERSNREIIISDEDDFLEFYPISNILQKNTLFFFNLAENYSILINDLKISIFNEKIFSEMWDFCTNLG